jgi:hypothetical protein
MDTVCAFLNLATQKNVNFFSRLKNSQTDKEIVSFSLVCSTFVRDLLPFTFPRQLHTLGRGGGDFAHTVNLG